MEKSIKLWKKSCKGGAEVIYENIKKLCKKKKISIYRVEKDLGFSASSIVKWKKAVPAADKLKAVADYLGVSMEYLLSDQKESAWGPQGWIGGEGKTDVRLFR